MSSVTSDLSVLNVCRYDYFPGWRLVSHYHQGYFQVFYIFEGKGIAWINNQPFSLRPGAVIFIAPGIDHGLRPDQQRALRTIDAKFRVRTSELLNFCNHIPALQYPNDSNILTILETIQEEAEQRVVFFQEICQLKLKELIIRLARIQNDNSRNLVKVTNNEVIPRLKSRSDVAEKLLLYFRSHYNESLTSYRISRAISYSYRYLSNKCRQAFSMSPLELLMYVRVEAAQKRILETSDTLKEIAVECGFANVYHFNRVFSRLIGTPPGIWRRKKKRIANRTYAIDLKFKDHDRTAH